MKKTQKLEANRNIKDQLSSFISIVVIAMLAVTVYLGIAFSARAMDVNISGYYNRLNMQDLVVYSPLLMTGDDAEAIRAVDGVAEVEGGNETVAWLPTDSGVISVSVITMASVGYAAAIDAGELQAAVSTNPWSEKNLLDLGGQVIVDGTDDAAIEEIIGSSSYELFVMMASDAYIAENGETVQKVVNAVAKAMQWMENATPEEIAENLLPLFEGAQEELLYDANYDKEHSITSYTGYHTESGYQAAINLTKLAGGITKDIPAEEIYDDSFLDAAWEALK